MKARTMGSAAARLHGRFDTAPGLQMMGQGAEPDPNGDMPRRVPETFSFQVRRDAWCVIADSTSLCRNRHDPVPGCMDPVPCPRVTHTTVPRPRVMSSRSKKKVKVIQRFGICNQPRAASTI